MQCGNTAIPCLGVTAGMAARMSLPGLSRTRAYWCTTCKASHMIQFPPRGGSRIMLRS